MGTVQVRSLVEPLRKIIARLKGHLLNARAVDLVMPERLLEVEETCGSNGMEKRHVYVPYDKLVIAVGSTSSTHGVPGLEHCFHLKTIGDAQKIRQRIIGACIVPFCIANSHVLNDIYVLSIVWQTTVCVVVNFARQF